MARPRNPNSAVAIAAQVIRANALTDAELDTQLDSLWKSGYQAGRKAAIRADLVAKGVASIAKLRQAAKLAPLGTTHAKIQSVGKIAIKP